MNSRTLKSNDTSREKIKRIKGGNDQIFEKITETHELKNTRKIKAETESSAKTQFLANVSHELRTPLNAIIGFSEMILSETYGKLENTQYKDYINDINNSGKHLLSVNSNGLKNDQS